MFILRYDTLTLKYTSNMSQLNLAHFSIALIWHIFFSTHSVPNNYSQEKKSINEHNWNNPLFFIKKIH